MTGPYELSDYGNAQRFLDRAADNVRRIFSTEGRKTDSEYWMYWDGRKWVDGGGESAARAMFVETMLDAQETEAPLWPNLPRPGKRTTAQEDFYSFILDSRNNGRINSGLKVAADRQQIRVPQQRLDDHSPYLLCMNGVFDVRRMALVEPPDGEEEYDADGWPRPYFAKHLMQQKTLGANFVPGAECPRWIKFLESVLPDPEVRRWVQKAIGYTLTGEANEKIMVVLYGKKHTGKSAFINTLLKIFADYGMTASRDALLPRKAGGGPTQDRDNMCGKRFVSGSETGSHDKIDESLVKSITGRDPQTTRRLFGTEHTWTPQCVVWISSNNHIKITGDDDAIWDRVKPVTFPRQFLSGDPERDPNIEKKLEEELDGILQWVIEGLKLYREEGLDDAPGAMLEAAMQMRIEGDGVRQFLAEGQEEGWLKYDPMDTDLAFVKAELYQVYKDWCHHTNAWKPLGRNRFYERLETAGLKTTDSAVAASGLADRRTKVRGVAVGLLPAPFSPLLRGGPPPF